MNSQNIGLVMHFFFITNQFGTQQNKTKLKEMKIHTIHTEKEKICDSSNSPLQFNVFSNRMFCFVNSCNYSLQGNTEISMKTFEKLEKSQI